MALSQREASSAFLALNGLFKSILASKDIPPWVNVATKVDSTTFEEYYPWLGNSPQMREWDRDDKVVNDLDVQTMMIINKDYETTIKVPKSYIADNRLSSMNVGVA